MNRTLLIFLIILEPVVSASQIGSVDIYDFLNLAHSARISSLGGYPVAMIDDDVNMGLLNPSALNAQMNHRLSVNHNFHFADIHYGSSLYSFHFDKDSTSILIGANYLSYGDFIRANLVGEQLGTFNSKESALILGLARKLNDRMRWGINLKYVSSSFDTYSSSGLGLDFSITYTRPTQRSHWAFVIKNIGFQFDSYSDTRENFPLDVILGYSKRLEHLPFRFYVSAHRLNRWNLKNNLRTETDPIFIDGTPKEQSGFSVGIENFFRHFTFGGELSLGKNEVFMIRLGYDHNRKKDLAVSGFRSFSGLSLGFGIKIKKLRFDYGFGRYHLAGSANHLSLQMDLHSIFSKL